MNRAGMTMLSVAAGTAVHASASKVSITSRAVLNRLSLKAPKNWVQKNGAKRRWANRANWLDGCEVRMAGRPVMIKPVKYSTSPGSTNKVCQAVFHPFRAHGPLLAVPRHATSQGRLAAHHETANHLATSPLAGSCHDPSCRPLLSRAGLADAALRTGIARRTRAP